MANNSRDRDNTGKLSDRRNYYIGRNTMKWDKRTGSTKRIGKGRWTIIGRKWNCLYGRKNLYIK